MRMSDAHAALETGLAALAAAPGPEAPIDDAEQHASIIVDGTKLAFMRAKPGRERLVTDLAANVSKLSGLHTIGVRLELVTA